MKKRLFSLLFGIFLLFSLKAETKLSLAILPFSGVLGGEEEALTALLSRQEDLHRAFNMIPCATNFNEIISGLKSGTHTSSADIISEIKNQLNTDFVAIVFAQRIEDSNISLVSLVDVRTLEQTAGDHRRYANITEMRNMVSDIAKKIIDGVVEKPALPRITVLPFYSNSNELENDANILNQLLNIELANSGKYSVFPWALIIDQYINNRNIFYSYGVVDPISLSEFGRAENIQYVLTADLLEQERNNLFMASILNIEMAEVFANVDTEYLTITGDYNSVTNLARNLVTGTRSSIALIRDLAAGVSIRTISSAITRNTFSQSQKPSLTILPFSGIRGADEETVSILLANQEILRNSFNVLPSTTNFIELKKYMLSKTFSSKTDIVNELRTILRTDFVLIIQVEKTKTSSILLISLINTENLQHVSGYYEKYVVVRNVRPLLQNIAEGIISSTQQNTDSTLPKLMLLPFYTSNEVGNNDADIFSHYLTIKIANSKKYTLFPWDLMIETAVNNFEMPYFGIIDPKSTRTFGASAGNPYILTGSILNLGTSNLFMTSIVRSEDAITIASSDLEYRSVTEDMELLLELANTIINPQ